MQSSDHIHHDEIPNGSIRQTPDLRQKETNIAVAHAPVDEGIEALDTVIRLIRENTEPSGLEEEHITR